MGRLRKTIEEKSPVDHLKFIDTTSSEAAYILGFLWADGWIGNTKPNKIERLNISLQIVEDDAKEIYLKAFKFTGNWCYNLKKKGKRHTKQSVVIYTSNRYLHNFLQENDYTVKSNVSPAKILSKIPKQLHKDFWRGYIDGDGCWYYFIDPKGFIKMERLTIAGTRNQDWSDVQKLLDEIGVKHKVTFIDRKTGSSSFIRVCGKHNLKKIGEYLYSKVENNLYLERKFKKYNEIISRKDKIKL